MQNEYNFKSKMEGDGRPHHHLFVIITIFIVLKRLRLERRAGERERREDPQDHHAPLTDLPNLVS